MRKKVEAVDVATGEIMQGVLVYIPHRPKIKDGWFMAFQDTFENIAKDPDMTGEAFRVLTYLYSKLDFANYIYQCQADIAQALNMRSANVSRAIKLLTTKQIVLKGPRVSRLTCYRLNPNYGWKGKVASLSAARQEHLTVVTGGKN